MNLDNGVLSITGEKHEEKETGKKGSKQHRMERFRGSFMRRFTLPAKIKSDKVDASFKDGVLSLVIPKAEESKTKGIAIKVKQPLGVVDRNLKFANDVVESIIKV